MIFLASHVDMSDFSDIFENQLKMFRGSFLLPTFMTNDKTRIFSKFKGDHYIFTLENKFCVYNTILHVFPCGVTQSFPPQLNEAEQYKQHQI